MKQTGAITVFIGPMFSGKSDMLIGEILSAQRRKKRILLIKPVQDTRSGDKIASKKYRDDKKKFEEATSVEAHSVNSADEILRLVEKTRCQIVFADEAQFFGEDFPELVAKLAWDMGIDVYLAGLDLNYKRRPFEKRTMGDLLCLADSTVRRQADCFGDRCDQKARFTQKIGGSGREIDPGSDNYQACCNSCWYPYEDEPIKTSI